MYQPTETDIKCAIEKIDAAYGLTSKIATVACRLKTLLEDMEQRSESSDVSDALTVITNGHELSALVDWLIEQPDNLGLMDVRSALGGDIDVDGDTPVSDNPDLDFDSMSLFERVASGESGGGDLQEVSNLLLEAARTLIKLSANADEGATTVTSRANELIELAQSFQTEANQPRRGICVA